MVRPMVHSTKHYVQQSLNTITGSASSNIVIAVATKIVNKNVTNEVEEGASIKACYVESWLRAAGASPGSVITVIAKQPGGGANFTTTELAALGDAENKKNILFTSQGLVNDNDANAIAVTRGWYKIPKSKQRFGLGDKLVMQIFAQGAIDLVHCGFETYKEYT